MDHNEFQLIEDLVAPFKQFIQQLEAPQKRQPEEQQNQEESKTAVEKPSQG